jgi:hypothetical protein
MYSDNSNSHILRLWVLVYAVADAGTQAIRTRNQLNPSGLPVLLAFPTYGPIFA